jgi:hypothetical protein
MFETLAGIYYHRNKTVGDNRYLFGFPIPEEYKVVRVADPAAYTVADLTDAVGYGTLVAEPLVAKALGRDKRERLKTIVDAVIAESREKGTVSFSEGQVFEQYMELRHFMKKEVYAKTPQKGYAYWLEILYEYFAERASDVIPPAVAVALMTDEEAEKLSLSLMHGRQPSLKGSPFGVAEIIHDLRGRGKQNLNYSDPDLDWGKEREPMPLK